MNEYQVVTVSEKPKGPYHLFITGKDDTCFITKRKYQRSCVLPRWTLLGKTPEDVKSMILNNCPKDYLKTYEGIIIDDCLQIQRKEG